MERIVNIERVIKEIDRDKRNYSRRANHKIKKLRGIIEQLIDGKDPEEIVEESLFELGYEDVVETQKTSNDVKTKKVESLARKIDYSEPFTLSFDESLNYELWTDNKWIDFKPGNIRAGDKFRMTNPDGSIVTINDVGYFESLENAFTEDKNEIEVLYGFTPKTD